MTLSAVEKKKAAVTPARRAELRARMLTAVEALLDAGENYTELSVERLIKAVRISRATFYIYFEDKGALLATLADDVVSGLIRDSSSWWALTEATSRENLYQSLRPVVDSYRQHISILRAVSDMAGYDQRLRDRLNTLVTIASATFSSAIRTGQQRGVVRQELDSDITTPWLIWMAERGLGQLLTTDDEAVVEARVRGLSDILWFALYDVSPNGLVHDRTGDSKPI